MRWRSVSFSIPACSGQDGNTTNLKRGGRLRAQSCIGTAVNLKEPIAPLFSTRILLSVIVASVRPGYHPRPSNRGKGHEMYDFAGVFWFAGRALAATALIVAIGGAAQALYDVGPGEIPGKPGSIIRVWPL